MDFAWTIQDHGGPEPAPSAGPRLVPEIPTDMEALVVRMTGVLVVEVFAVEAFRWARAVLGDAELFRRHDQVRTLIEFIQQDETPHVGYLATALAELDAGRAGALTTLAVGSARR